MSTHQDKISWIRLLRSENVGPVTFRQLLERFGSADAALSQLPELSRRGGRAKSIKITPISEAEAELAALEEAGVVVLLQKDKEYPALLRQVEDAPPVLFCKGNLHLLRRDSIAIVGARNSSGNGIRLAHHFAEQLGQKELVITSGLARGIDTAAHKAALSTGTIAVIAGGVDHIYPQENAELFEKIANQGLIVTEHPMGTEPQARFFPRRNRIISGLSQAVVVIEAALKSGSLITARLAAEQGRDVFAVPGSPLDARAKGTNKLIKEGAFLVEEVSDILDTIAHQSYLQDAPSSFQPANQPALVAEVDVENHRHHLETLLSPTPIEIDDLVRLMDVPVPIVLTILLEMELAGRVSRHAGNRVAIVQVPAQNLGT